MKTISLWGLWAYLISIGAKGIETRSWKTNYRGPILIHSTLQITPEEIASMPIPVIHDVVWPALGFPSRPMPASCSVVIPRGVIVASALLAHVLPIIAVRESPYEIHATPAVIAVGPARGGRPRLWHVVGDTAADITDQVPYGDFTPGRFAWMLTDVKPTTERCPHCWGAGQNNEPIDEAHPEFGPVASVCSTCGGPGKCEPVPAVGHQGLWNWNPA